MNPRRLPSTPSNPASGQHISRLRAIAAIADSLVRLDAGAGPIPAADVDKAIKEIAKHCRQHESEKYPSISNCHKCHHAVHTGRRCLGNRNLCQCGR